MKQQAILIGLLALTLGVLMLVVECLRPGRSFPKVRGWLARAIAINAIQIGSVYLAGALWNGWMVHHRLWSMDRLGATVGALLGYFVLTFVCYWWHLWRHRSDFLWRWLHQVHHSAQRLEVLTAFYKQSNRRESYSENSRGACSAKLSTRAKSATSSLALASAAIAS